MEIDEWGKSTRRDQLAAARNTMISSDVSKTFAQTSARLFIGSTNS
jgi:hypothetical protein